jgi:hypothetical protein
MIAVQQTGQKIAAEPFATGVARRTARMQALWWDCGSRLPELGRSYTSAEQRAQESRLSSLRERLTAEWKRLPPGAVEQSAALRERTLDDAFVFLTETFDFPAASLDVLRRSGLIEATEAFARRARQYDPAIASADIFQASRNVMTMNFAQLLMGLPVELTPSVFAYSMLYPYTDNYLDDPRVPLQEKAGFNRHFYQRLAGERLTPGNAYEERIWDLVAMVEDQWPRANWPQVYDSLLAILSAQARSMRQLRGSVSPYEVDVLGISFEKGGTSVLADGYLVAGALTEEQADFLFAYGAYTQLMDDLEDVDADRRAGFLTIFSQTAGHWPLDALTNTAFHMGARIFSQMERFPVAEARPLQDLVLRALNPLLSASAAGAGRYYTRPYLRTLEAHMPLRFAALSDQRKKLERARLPLEVFVG